MAKEKKYKPFIVEPKLSHRCEKCGKWFVRRHVKDDERYCEKCRKAMTNG